MVVRVELQALEMIENLCQQDGGLEAGEVHSEANVGSEPKGKMRLRRPEMSNRSGSCQRWGSRLAARSRTITTLPAPIAVPATSVATSDRRGMIVNGGSHRRPSSIACGRRDRSCRNASNCSPWVRSAYRRFAEERTWFPRRQGAALDGDTAVAQGLLQFLSKSG
jgi:hypothetical protein